MRATSRGRLRHRAEINVSYQQLTTSSLRAGLLADRYEANSKLAGNKV
ncbi:MAG: hypothetical protein JWQ54_1725 [Mucilaginibacter sp.]|nr:hypothetical protein [Mucilaginibacter sp.]